MSFPFRDPAADVPPDVSSDAKPRRFEPQLIATARRSRRVGDTRPAHHPTDRTDAIPGQPEARKPLPRRPKLITRNTTGTLDRLNPTREMRRLGIPLPKRRCSFNSTRPFSPFSPFDDDTPELSTSPSSASETDCPSKRGSASPTYLLDLAALPSRADLEAAVAAFPNEDRHVPIAHFVDSSNDDYDTRERADSFNWELKDMRAHTALLEAEREKERARREARRQRARQMSDRWAPPQKIVLPPPSPPRQPDGEMERMRRQARPPMLGTEIKFPRCVSPDRARFDTTQGSHAARSAMCYLTAHTGDASRTATEHRSGSGLWCPKGVSGGACGTQGSLWSRGSSSRAVSPSNVSPTNSNSSSNSNIKGTSGLWGGFCVDSGTPLRGPMGLVTPMVEEPGFNWVRERGLPPSPPPSTWDGLHEELEEKAMATVTEIVEEPESIEKEEFDDAFVTQVYNYLSLGYPALGRRYDGELSRVTRVPIEELRKDDNLSAARGYIRLGEGEECCGAAVGEESCARWRALRKYIQEWGRQCPKMMEEERGLALMRGVGMGERRGSWRG
ncbi:hypothetical protein EJ06DRAFT_302517 [Trichodelitschia bisporula]|uniref:Uncharacterized protein n=1 Tax=Trichodelitschia bisporula TaxID=703511 RepID=A0A6G1I6U1_9PEZI|nr:hypothetical protein EJ06DRAFT_302517 [Trichodelitschia bisporula]